MTGTGPPRQPLGGLLLALGGVFCLSINDLLIKFLSGGYALHELILCRAVIGMALILATLKLSGRSFATLRSRRPWAQTLRVSLMMLSNATYFLGLSVMPLADAVAISYVSPLCMTGLSVLVLGERVGWARWAAVLAGMAGVLVIVQPGTDAFRPAALLVLCGAVSYALTQVMARRMAGTESTFALSFYVQCGFITLSALVGLLLGDGHLAGDSGGAMNFLLRKWYWPPPADWPVLLAAGSAVAFGGLAMSQSYRMLETALVAPLEYLGMPLAILWGVLVFWQWPEPSSWLGMALICGAGLFTIGQEQSDKKARHET